MFLCPKKDKGIFHRPSLVFYNAQIRRLLWCFLSLPTLNDTMCTLRGERELNGNRTRFPASCMRLRSSLWWHLAIIVINIIIIIIIIYATWLTTKPSLLKSLERTPAWEIGRAEPAPTSSDSNTAFLNLSRLSKRLYEKIKKTELNWARETLVVKIHLDLFLQSVT